VALPKLININPGGAQGAQFAPAALDVLAGDVITWSNNDPANAHWPGQTATATGPVVNAIFFMPNQIAAGDTSDDFRPGDSGVTLYYACSLHSQERGSIVVG
jgi:plastocyanin